MNEQQNLKISEALNWYSQQSSHDKITYKNLFGVKGSKMGDTTIDEIVNMHHKYKVTNESN